MKTKILILLAVFSTFLVSCNKDMKWINPDDSKADQAEILKICEEKNAECGQIEYELDGKMRKIFCGECHQKGYECKTYNRCGDIDECADSSLNNCPENTECINEYGTYSCICKENYSGDDCLPDTRLEECKGLPVNASWNTISEITQTWNGSEWVPSNKGSFSEEASETECRFKCKEHYVWNESNSICVGAIQTVNCDPKPENTVWNTVDTITQTYKGTDWEPSATPVYNTTASESECRYKCASGYNWNGISCIEPSVLSSLTIGNICTGQDKCYSNSTEIECPESQSGTDDEYNFFGQDAQYAAQGVCTPQNFTASSDVVLDNNTGLLWQRNLPEAYTGCSSSTGCTYSEAQTYCSKLSLSGLSNWRVPNPLELLTIVDNSTYNPATNWNFAGMQTGTDAYLWTNNEHKNYTDDAYYFSPSYGWYSYAAKTITYKVRCVSGEEMKPAVSSDFTTSSDDKTVTDNRTGLMWQKEYGTDKTWQQALEYCENSTYAGYSDWRLPNKNELASLINYGIYNPASDFPDMPNNGFWSSSTYVSDTSYAWHVAFNIGNVTRDNKNGPNEVRCVRNAKEELACIAAGGTWNGAECLNPCDPNPCADITNSTGVCTASGTGYVCGCNDDYEWSGNQCLSTEEKCCYEAGGTYYDYWEGELRCYRDVDCAPKPANTEWSGRGSYFEYYDFDSDTWTDYEGSHSTEYDYNGEAQTCQFVCAASFDWNGFACTNGGSFLPECSPTSGTPCHDSSIGLTWSAKSLNLMSWENAKVYCDGLSEGDFTDWRLPNIDELKTLITVPNGIPKTASCLVSEANNCLTETCWDNHCAENCFDNEDSNINCNEYDDGRFSKLGDTEWLWSFSLIQNLSNEPWLVLFLNGLVSGNVVGGDHNVRCVRGELNTRSESCSNKPENTEWNDDGRNGKFTQILTESGWNPTSYASSYSTDSGACRYKCENGYFWDGSICKKYLSLGNICTGQNKCYNNEEEITCPASPSGTDEGYNFYGQDAQYASHGICTPQSFTATSNVIVDNNTGLTWQRNVPETYTECASGTACTFSEAQTYCSNLSLNGLNNWRVPNPLEFLTIVDNSTYNLATNSNFTNMPAENDSSLWTNSEYKGDPDHAYHFIPYYGWSWYDGTKTDPHKVLCVSGEEIKTAVSDDFTISSDGKTVTDSRTGLIWKKEYETNKTWQQALEYCQSLNTEGYGGCSTGWRLPNKNELASLINYEKSGPPFSYFPDMSTNYFWSSSTYVGSLSGAWIVHFYYGLARSLYKTATNDVLCVRNGNNLNTGDTSGNQAQTGTVGAVCTSDSQCTQTYGSGDDGQIAVCLTQSGNGFPSGYCSFMCDPTDQQACDSVGEICHLYNNYYGYCYHKCTKPSDCRVGYRCSNKIHACLPDCASTGCLTGTCDATDKVCL